MGTRRRADGDAPVIFPPDQEECDKTKIQAVARAVGRDAWNDKQTNTTAWLPYFVNSKEDVS